MKGHPMDYQFWKLTAGVIVTIGLYSVLYRENKFYRFVEHVFLGLAGGWALVTLWSDVLYDLWWKQMVGQVAANGGVAKDGYWAYALLLPLGLMGYFVFSRKNNWISRIPIGVILGLWSGQQVQVWFNTYGPQINNSMRPILPTTWTFKPDTFGFTPEQLAAVKNEVYLSQAINNLIFVITILCCLSYFFYSFDVKNKLLAAASTTGRWLLMIGFGAIFGSTVMMRFSLLIDRMYFVWIEWFKGHVWPF